VCRRVISILNICSVAKCKISVQDTKSLIRIVVVSILTLLVLYP